MIEQDMMFMFFAGFLIFVIGICIGQFMLKADTESAVRKVEQWIDDTTSNKWVQYEIYQDLEEKYEALLREYEQYRGTMKAINDCCKGDKSE